MPKIVLAALVAALLPASAGAQVFQAGDVALRAEILTDGLEHPWGIDFLPDGGAIVTERTGTVRIFADGRLSESVSGVPEVAVMGQGGLLDVALAADFEASRTLFLSYAEPGPGGAGTAVARARLVQEEGSARLEDVAVIFSMDRKTGESRHFGSRIVAAPDGTLFFTIGDRGDMNRAQDPFDHAGSVMRINPDGSVPEDNPFVGTEEAAPEIWSIGHRNPQGAVFDPVTDALWTVEHGPRGGDEVNRPEAGKNYGWPVISYGRHYSGRSIERGAEAPGYEQPRYYWDPSIAPSGMAVYDGPMFHEWEGDFLVAALSFQLLARLERDGSGEITGEERLFEGTLGRLRDVEVAPDGSVWLLTDESNGKIIRISRAE
ncbi:PQQ-dependent sugar dehydrogenase [Chelativorans salis]|uniref:PQQ-dependent sugar dehydrogenase n=1 Tax=Chelativorans salis TaxID=2978478 RepID=A0ABT2LNW5_9HYPH|nr:PQQ-dependent sugar dehydrogenase [Chelativorans sp. EGI FJ00035]MCT7374869.1 PQQ-dependent sugar dehydrogenase [Chelativorans sp. EGI FJ00035]